MTRHIYCYSISHLLSNSYSPTAIKLSPATMKVGFPCFCPLRLYNIAGKEGSKDMDNCLQSKLPAKDMHMTMINCKMGYMTRFQEIQEGIHETGA